jgi:uncharacterized protein YgbK (DUF1537 family)
MTPSPAAAPLAFYGDDFTGASANLVEYHRRGLRGVLFVNTPTYAEAAAQAAHVDVLGIAGVSRSLAPDAMEAELRPAFELFRRLESRVVQYKICATFDSSPTRGSFGPVLELARQVFGPSNIPVLAAHPSFGRYTAFGNHFAVWQQEVYRLDRHPSMSRHPETPMGEADLRKHLALQTALALGLCDVVTLRAASQAQLDALLQQQDVAATVFDAMAPEDLVTVAAAAWRASRRRRVFALAAHGFAAGMAEHLARERNIPQRTASRRQEPVERLLVLSGSCSPRTAAQIEHAHRAGWRALRLPIEALAGESTEAVAQRMAVEILETLERGQSMVVYAAAGPDDENIAAGRGVFGAIEAESSAMIGALYAEIARRVFARMRLPRLMLAGGDTSSQTVRKMGVQALAIDAMHPETAEAFMRMQAPGTVFDGVQLLMKAGQNGAAEYFTQAREGHHWQ